MEKLRETFIKKYGIWEYILFGLGLVFLGRVGYEFVTISLEELTWDIIAILMVFVALGALLVGAPKTILDWGRKKVGLNQKNNGNNA